MDESMEMQDNSDGDVISDAWSDSEKHRGRFGDVFKMPRIGGEFRADFDVATPSTKTSLVDSLLFGAEFSSLEEIAESPELCRSLESDFSSSRSGQWRVFAGADMVR